VKMKNQILLMVGALAVSISGGAYPIDSMVCQPLSSRLSKEDREYKNFENLVVQPLRREKAEIDRNYDLEVNGPERLARENRELEGANNSLSAENGRLQSNIQTNENRAAAFDQEAVEHDGRGEKNKAKDKRQKASKLRNENSKLERKMSENTSRIERNNGKVDANKARIVEIQTTPPTRQELEVKLAEINAKLADVAGLRREKEEDVRNTLYALDVCVAYEVLREKMIETVRAQGWVTDYRRCSSSWPSTNPGVEMARRDARMITGCQ